MIRSYNRLICLFAILACLFGCKTSDKDNKNNKVSIHMLPTIEEISAKKSKPDSYVQQTLDPDNKLAEIASDYRLAPGDIIELYSIDTPEVARKYVLGPDGKITVPGVGVVDLEKLTREEAAKKISKKLSFDYIDPNVDVLVIEYNGNEIYVLGALLRTGIFSFKGRPTLLSAISRAEGFQSNADLRSCQVLRGRGTIINIDIYQLLAGDQTLNIDLLPGDTVFVKENQEHTFYLMGEFNKPGVFSLGEDMNLVRAMGLGQGYTDNANLNAVTIIRDYQGENPQIEKVNIRELMAGKKIDNDLIVNAGDLIYVPKRGIAKVNYFLTQLSPALSWLILSDLVAK